MFKSISQAFRSQKKRGGLIEQLSCDEGNLAQLDTLIQQEEAFNREILLALFNTTTAVIHIYLGGVLFTLNGVGFLAFLAARHILPPRESYQKYVREGNFIYSGLTIIPYFAAYGLSGGFQMTTDLISKLAEIGIMYVLWQERKAVLNGETITVIIDDVDPAINSNLTPEMAPA